MCFRFGTYYDSRFLSLTCFAVRGFRWTLKFIKVTYESWNLEMEYAKCVSESYGMNIPFFTPPWNRDSRSLTGTDHSDKKLIALHDDLPFMQIIPKRQLAKSSKRDLHQKLVSQSLARSDHNIKLLQDKSDTFQKLLFVNDEVPDHDIFLSSEIQSQQEFLRIIKSLFQILLSLFNEIKSQLLRTFGSGILSCTRKYLKGALWRWVDSAPF